jgi:hypothetical protein
MPSMRVRKREMFRFAGALAGAMFLFAGGLLVATGCGSKSGGGTTPPATIVYTTNGKTLTTVTGP